LRKIINHEIWLNDELKNNKTLTKRSMRKNRIKKIRTELKRTIHHICNWMSKVKNKPKFYKRSRIKIKRIGIEIEKPK
jgi:hypothetical protein